MSEGNDNDFKALYSGFSDPIFQEDCGNRCGPYNEKGVPFCCDIRHVIPTAYSLEWDYLKSSTNLWHLWISEDKSDMEEMQDEIPERQVLIACLGYLNCQREYRAVTCRSFPFFPYFSRESNFIGFSYYWEFEDRCWIISNLHTVSRMYCSQFFQTYQTIFENYPEEIENYCYQSHLMRCIFKKNRRAITLLDRNGYFYKISPQNGRMRKTAPEDLQKYGPYAIASRMPFADE
ncbi:hypothetical protein ACFLUC_00365 [Chloroflexota bacterium]